MVLRRANVGCGSIRPEGWDNYDAHYDEGDAKNVMHWNVMRPLGRNPHLQFSDAYGNYTGPSPVADWEQRDGKYQPVEVVAEYDYIVCSFLLSDLGHHELPEALTNIRRALKRGGVLRVLVPDVVRAFRAFEASDEGWFPQDHRTGGLDAKFCTFVTWFGTVKSVFTVRYLSQLMSSAGFKQVGRCEFGESLLLPDSEICSLDSRRPEALIVEGARW